MIDGWYAPYYRLAWNADNLQCHITCLVNLTGDVFELDESIDEKTQILLLFVVVVAAQVRCKILSSPGVKLGDTISSIFCSTGHCKSIASHNSSFETIRCKFGCWLDLFTVQW